MNKNIVKIVISIVVGLLIFALIGVGVFCINKDYERKRQSLPWKECETFTIRHNDGEETHSTSINFRQEYYYDGTERVWFRTVNTRTGTSMIWGVFNINDVKITPPLETNLVSESQNIGV